MPYLHPAANPHKPGSTYPAAWTGVTRIYIDADTPAITLRRDTYADHAAAYTPGATPLAAEERILIGGDYAAFLAANPDLFARIVQAADAWLAGQPEYAGAGHVPPGPPQES